MNRILISVIIVLSSMFLVCCSDDKQNKPTPSTISEAIEMGRNQVVSTVNTYNITGLGIAITNKESILWEESFGFSDKENNAKANSDTKYIIGSVTKVFTAVAVMQCLEKGLIELDAPLARYIPEFKLKTRFKNNDSISIRQILTHHGGIPGDVLDHKFASEQPYFTDLLNYIQDYYPTAPAGTILSYSNLGYALLGILIERVSGEDYYSFVRNHIFNPLGMNNTDFFLNMADTAKFAASYNLDGDRVIEYPIFDTPAGAIYSDIGDMSRFIRAFLNKGGNMLSEKSIKEMFRLQNKNVPLDLDERIGLCLFFSQSGYDAGQIYEHGGATTYHRAQMYIAPEVGLGAIVLSNHPKGQKETWKIRENLIPAIAKINGFKAEPSKIEYQQIDFKKIPKASFQDYEGIYATMGIQYQFDLIHNKLYSEIMGNNFYLYPEDDHTLVPAKRILGIYIPFREKCFILHEVNGHKIFIEALPWGDISIIGTRVQAKPIPSSWKEKYGTYVFTQIEKAEIHFIDTLHLKEKSGFPVLEYSLHKNYEAPDNLFLTLEVENDSTAFTAGLGRGCGETIYSYSRNNKDFINYSGLIFQKK